MSTLRAFHPVKIFSYSYLTQKTVLQEITKYLELAERDACFQPNARLTADGPVPAYEDSEPNLALSHLERIQAGLNGEVLHTDPDGVPLAGTKDGLDPDATGQKTDAQRKKAMGVHYQNDGLDHDHQAATAPDMGQDGWQDKEEYERQQEDITEGDMDEMTYRPGGKVVRETPTIVRGDLVDAEKRKAAKKDRRKEEKRQREEEKLLKGRKEPVVETGYINEEPIKDVSGYHDQDKVADRKRSHDSAEEVTQNGEDEAEDDGNDNEVEVEDDDGEDESEQPNKRQKTDHDSSDD